MFDEATSALDNITQKQVSDSLDSLDCTRVIIAHRLSTIASADQIILINNGNVEAAGTQEQLLADSPLYRQMWETHMAVKEGVSCLQH